MSNPAFPNSPSAPPRFFLPYASEAEQESVYASLASAVGCAPPSPEKRIYSITYRSRGETWVATVGETLRGTKLQVARSRGAKIERTVPLSNPSTVLAIFPGSPFQVWHDQKSNLWVNPFLAGEPLSITYFSA